jgi:hypothetical protein
MSAWLWNFGRVTEVPVSELEDIFKKTIGTETIAHLSSFGALMISESMQRWSQVETKLTSLLTLSSALVAFLFLGNELWRASSILLKGALVAALVCAMISLLSSFLGLRLVLTNWPSERDWFVISRFEHPEDLAKTHLLALLDAHQANGRLTAKKANHALRAQYGLLSGAAIICVIFLIRIAAG